jgi:hypothetical protein
VIAASLVLTSHAHAASKTQLHHRQVRQVHSLHRYQGTLRFFRHHRFLRRSFPDVVHRETHKARIWIQVIHRELAETRAALRPPPAPQLGHLAGWICIHSREGAWNAQTGNGFYGGLQMTYGWAGRVANAALLSPSAQIAAAENEASRHGWSYSWMSGQWPNTFPPCAALFGL